MPTERTPGRLPRILFLACLLAVAAVQAQANDQGNPTREMPLILNGRQIVTLTVQVSADGTRIRFPAEPVVFALSSILRPIELTTLEKRMDADSTLSNQDLTLFGIKVDFGSGQGPLTLIAIRGQTHLPGSSAPKVEVAAVGPESDAPWASPPMPALDSQSDISGNVPSTNVPVAAATASAAASPPVARGGRMSSAPETAVGATPESSPATPSNANPATPAAGSVAVKMHPAVPARSDSGRVSLPEPKVQSYLMESSRDELYEEVFKHKAPPAPPRMQVTLIVDDKNAGPVWIHFSPDHTHYTFTADPVLAALKEMIRSHDWESLAKSVDANGDFSPEILNDRGYPTSLNESLFELEINIPAQDFEARIHSLSGLPPDPNSVDAMKPNALTAFLNLNLDQRLNYSQNTYDPNDSLGFGGRIAATNDKSIRQPVVADWDGAVNLKGWVLEGKAIYWEQYGTQSNVLDRQDLRLLHDWPREALRLSFGDLSFPTLGYQSFAHIGGIGISRDFSLQPYRVAYPVKDYEFFLTNPSEVKVYVNGLLMSVLNLPPGTHDIRDFPVAEGESQVEIQITDNTGRKQDLTFNFIREIQLLAKGISAFSYDAGFPSRDVILSPLPNANPGGVEWFNYQYDTQHPWLFLSYQRGISDLLTLGGYAQGTDTLGLIGFDGLRASALGKFGLDVAGSFQPDSGSGIAGELSYTFLPRNAQRFPRTSWKSQIEYIGDGFKRPGLDSLWRSTLTFSESYQVVTRLLSANTDASYSFRSGQANFYAFSLNLHRAWSRGFSSTFSLKNTFDRSKLTTTSASATLNYDFNTDFQSIAASERVENHVPTGLADATGQRWDNYTDAHWDYNTSAPFPNNPSMSATASFAPLENEYDADINWKSDQGIADITARRLEPAYSGASYTNENYTDLSLQTALVYVDGSLALSRPISNSFLLVKGIKNESSNEIKVNPNPYGYDAMSHPFFPAVDPMLYPYNLKKIHLETAQTPFGTAQDSTDFLLYPSYKSGFALYLGTDAVIIGIGALMVGPGVPGHYQVFDIVALDKPNAKPQEGFTNAVGKFQLPRLKPGRYRITANVDGQEKSVDLTLPKKAGIIYPLGVLTLAP